MPVWSLHQHDLRSVHLYQRVYAEAEAVGIWFKMERSMCVDLRWTERSNRNSLHAYPCFLRLPPSEIQIYKYLQHGGMRLPNPNDKCSHLQFRDKQARPMQQELDQS